MVFNTHPEAERWIKEEMGWGVGGGGEMRNEILKKVSSPRNDVQF